jgi:hypothetical protein
MIWNGTIMEERLFDLRSEFERVTVGEDRSNDFVISGPRVSRSLDLFTRMHGGYALRLLGGMTGVLKTDERTELIEDHAGETLFISSGHRGTIHIGGVVLLFQFVEPPEKAQRRRLWRVSMAAWGSSETMLTAAG